MIKKNDSIYITGGKGFLGKAVTNMLSKNGYNRIVPLNSKLDLKDKKKTDDFFSVMKPNIIIHLAAVCGGIGANMTDPTAFLSDNASINLNVVNAACKIHNKHKCLKKFIGLGSVCQYPKFAPIPFKEESLWGGYPEETNAGYGLSKRLMLAHINACRDQYDFPGIFLIPVNMYGKNDCFDEKKSHVIPALIKRIRYLTSHLKQKDPHPDLICWGTGNASREFFNVKDAARAIMLAMEKYDKSDPVNLGNGIEIKISELVSLIAEKMNFTGNIIWDNTQPDGQPRRCLDVTRAKNEFGFEAEISLDKGLDELIKWYCE